MGSRGCLPADLLIPLRFVRLHTCEHGRRQLNWDSRIAHHRLWQATASAFNDDVVTPEHQMGELHRLEVAGGELAAGQPMFQAGQREPTSAPPGVSSR